MTTEKACNSYPLPLSCLEWFEKLSCLGKRMLAPLTDVATELGQLRAQSEPKIGSCRQAFLASLCASPQAPSPEPTHASLEPVAATGKWPAFPGLCSVRGAPHSCCSCSSHAVLPAPGRGKRTAAASWPTISRLVVHAPLRPASATAAPFPTGGIRGCSSPTSSHQLL